MRRALIILACTLLVLIILGLIVATWMPAIVQSRTRGAPSPTTPR
jgi:hypothetical protein